MVAPASKGFSLVELMIAVAILGIALAIAVPSFRDFIGNAQIRTVAESIKNGLQLSRSEAVKRNAVIVFDLNINDTSWNIGCVTVTTTCPATIQAKPAGEGGANSIGLQIVGNNQIRFTSLGTTDPNVPGQLSRVNVDNSDMDANDSKDLSILIGAGGSIRMCDPNLSDPEDLRSCPP